MLEISNGTFLFVGTVVIVNSSHKNFALAQKRRGENGSLGACPQENILRVMHSRTSENILL